MGVAEVRQGPAFAKRGAVGSSGAPAGPRQLLGLVRWGRDLEAALAVSRSSGRPVFCLVEGSGYPAAVFGEQVLGSSELAKAIQDSFEPVVSDGHGPEAAPEGSEAALVSYSYEKTYDGSWRHPLVRFLGPDGADIIPKREGVNTARAMATRMVSALQASGLPAPRGLLRLSRG